jgi:two-component system, cell cycle sensor histidine kinase and response regulator CckA
VEATDSSVPKLNILAAPTDRAGMTTRRGGPPRMTREARSQAPTILVVDDEEMVRASTARMLERRGYRVVTAARADEALAWLRSEAPVDLLISDIVMPETYGTDLIVMARQLRPGLPALLISGFADQDNARHHPIPPGVPFLSKPFDVSDLLAQVRALLGG